MSRTPLICFGQQPCGFLPRRFLHAKVVTARRLREEIGGEIVFFYHDSDHDPRETMTVLHDRRTGREARLNFLFQNKLQKKFAPLYLKRIEDGWQEKTARQLPCYVEREIADAFAAVRADNVADFCLEMYRRLGLLEGVRVVRSSDPLVRKKARPVTDFFVDVEHGGEIVRARYVGGRLLLHEGGECWTELPDRPFGPDQVSPSRDSRMQWMQSVVGCTHYIAGEGEMAYLDKPAFPEIMFVARDSIDRSSEAHVDYKC